MRGLLDEQAVPGRGSSARGDARLIAGWKGIRFKPFPTRRYVKFVHAIREQIARVNRKVGRGRLRVRRSIVVVWIIGRELRPEAPIEESFHDISVWPILLHER